jgi:RNA polymerase sigma-70 factor (ECF subfamily)
VDWLSDEDLMLRAQQGNRKALDVLVTRYYKPLLNFAYRHTGSRDRAADMVQKTFVRVCSSARTYQPGRKFSTWVYTIATNLCKDELRRKQVRREASLDEIEEKTGDITRFTETRSGEDLALEGISSERLWEEVRNLPEKFATPLLLHFRQGLGYNEIADVMGVPIGTVKSWTFHAVRRLRKRLVEEEFS